MALDLYEELTRVTRTLEQEGVDYALCGALALAVHGVPRATTDLDLLVREQDVDRVTACVAPLGFRFEAHPMRFDDGMRIRRISKIEGAETITLDLLLVDDNLEAVWRGRERLEVDGRDLWVVAREGLIQMKVWAGRPRDLADVRRLTELDR